jgi:hypothetical protein
MLQQLMYFKICRGGFHDMQAANWQLPLMRGHATCRCSVPEHNDGFRYSDQVT